MSVRSNGSKQIETATYFLPFLITNRKRREALFYVKINKYVVSV